MNNPFYFGSKVSNKILRKIILEDNLIPYCCSICKMPPMWYGNPISLDLDHINGINTDNRLVNLRFLCTHCHKQTSTYGGRNKGKIKASITNLTLQCHYHYNCNGIAYRVTCTYKMHEHDTGFLEIKNGTITQPHHIRIMNKLSK